MSHMRPKSILAILLVALVLTGTATAYKGKQLAREAVDIAPLTDQNGEQYALTTDANGVVVVSFIFTRCPDVCPMLCLLYTSPSPRDRQKSRMPSSA